MKTLTVKLPDHLDSSLERAAASRNLSKSAIVRELLQQSLATADALEPTAGTSLHDALAKYRVASRTGVPDLASNPDHLSAYGR